MGKLVGGGSGGGGSSGGGSGGGGSSGGGSGGDSGGGGGGSISFGDWSLPPGGEGLIIFGLWYAFLALQSLLNYVNEKAGTHLTLSSSPTVQSLKGLNVVGKPETHKVSPAAPIKEDSSSDRNTEPVKNDTRPQPKSETNVDDDHPVEKIDTRANDDYAGDIEVLVPPGPTSPIDSDGDSD